MRTKKQTPTAEQIFNAYFSKLTVSQRHEAVDFMGYLLSKTADKGEELAQKNRAKLIQPALDIMRESRKRHEANPISEAEILAEIKAHREGR